MVELPEATIGGVLWKKLFLKFSQYPQEKVEGLKACNFIKGPQHRCFPMNISKFLRLLISKSIWDRPLFDCFNSSLLHGPKDSSSKLHDGVRLQGPSHRSSSLFLSRHLCYAVMKICSKFTGEHPCRSVICGKAKSQITLLHGSWACK